MHFRKASELDLTGGDATTGHPTRRVDSVVGPFDSADETTHEDEEDDKSDATLVDQDCEAAPFQDCEAAPSTKRRKLSHVCVEPSEYPRSAFLPADDYVSGVCVSEQTAILELTHALDGTLSDKLQSNTFVLDDFDIYMPKTSLGHPTELTTLDKLQNAIGSPTLVFDGCLSDEDSGSKQRSVLRVRGVLFQTLAVEGYLLPDLDTNIYIQSRNARSANVWYRLGKPSRGYRRFYEPFTWLAQFTKLVMNYLADHDKVTLSHFRHRFYGWLREQFTDSDDFRSWHARCGYLTDFRTNVGAHVGYIWKECYSIDQQDQKLGLHKHPFWFEIDPLQLKAVYQHPEIEQHTVVTPFVFESFRKVYFGEMLEKRPIFDDELLASVNRRKEQFGLTLFNELPDTSSSSTTPIQAAPSRPVEQGDVVAVDPDEKNIWEGAEEETTQKPIKRSTDKSIEEPTKKPAKKPWFAYVQRRWTDTGRGIEMLDVLWLYDPSQTTLKGADYPFKQELFLSDNCNCRHKAIASSRVRHLVDVTFHIGRRSSKACPSGSKPFVRRKYRTIENRYDFSSLEESDMRCRHYKPTPPSIWEQCNLDYKAGDTVLVRCVGGLEPAQVVSFDVQRRRVIVQRFVFRRTHDPIVRQHAASSRSKAVQPNELLVCSERLSKAASYVVRRCHISLFSTKEIADLPAPYSLGGTGDIFFINCEENDLALLAWPLVYGSNGAPTSPRARASIGASYSTRGASASMDSLKLNGLGIFCGGGNFDRGLEEGGPIRFKWAVDWDEAAIYTYRANAHGQVKYFLGSVNDYLAQALAGRRDVAALTMIDLISAGSPCPGFSNMQADKSSFQSLRNASMVASVLSFVDFYSPRYLVFENVVALAKTRNIFPQILATLVAMGYQVQHSNLGAWSYGSSQVRRRVFIIASLPWIEPVDVTPYSHGNHADWKAMSLGTSNGLKFGVERDDWTTFKHVSAEEATRDLPNIGDGQVQICPAFPDHRTALRGRALNRSIIASIPVLPRGMGISRACNNGGGSGALLDFFNRLTVEQRALRSRSFSRIRPDGLFPTVLTGSPIRCSRTGRVLHWTQHRSITVMEKRRAQGFLDHEVIVGIPSQQSRVIGNSVDRKVALALGLAIRGSWEKTVARMSADEVAAELMNRDRADHAERIDADVDVDCDAYIDLANLSAADLAALHHRHRTSAAWVELDRRSVTGLRTDSREPSETTRTDRDGMTASAETSADERDGKWE